MPIVALGGFSLSFDAAHFPGILMIFVPVYGYRMYTHVELLNGEHTTRKGESHEGDFSSREKRSFGS